MGGKKRGLSPEEVEKVLGSGTFSINGVALKTANINRKKMGKRARKRLEANQKKTSDESEGVSTEDSSNDFDMPVAFTKMVCETDINFGAKNSTVGGNTCELAAIRPPINQQVKPSNFYEQNANKKYMVLVETIPNEQGIKKNVFKSIPYGNDKRF